MTQLPLRLYGHILVILAMIIAAAALFTALASELVEGELAETDAFGSRWAASTQSPAADLFFGATTRLVTAIFIVPLCLVAVVVLRRRHKGRLALLIAVSPIVAMIVVHILKSFYTRPRPIHVVPALRSFRFPSGHTTTATAVGFTIAYIFVREGMISGFHLIWAILLSLLVGASRVYLGAHWTSDVIGGLIVGVAIASFCCLLYEGSITAPHSA